MAGLLATGELPKVTRGPGGRRPGKWKGHEQMAVELRTLRGRTKDPEKAWGKVAERENSVKAQAIISAIKKGEAVGFEPDDNGGYFEARSRKSANQHKAPINPKTKQPVVFYDVWARYVPKD